MYASSQSETTLQCSNISHWLGTYTDWSLQWTILFILINSLIYWFPYYMSAICIFVIWWPGTFYQQNNFHGIYEWKKSLNPICKYHSFITMDGYMHVFRDILESGKNEKAVIYSKRGEKSSNLKEYSFWLLSEKLCLPLLSNNWDLISMG